MQIRSAADTIIFSMNVKIASLLGLILTSLSNAAGNPHWIVTWGASPSPQQGEAQLRNAKMMYENQTVREILHTSIGGETVRIRLSNAYGQQAVDIGAAHIALSAKEASIVAISDHVLTFGGSPRVTIPANAMVVSDPVKLNLPDAGDVAISLFLPKATVAAGIHYASQQTTYIGRGDVTGSASVPDAITIESWVFLSDLAVLAPEQEATLVTFGDSITDGAHSTTNANHRWPDFLSQRLQAKQGQPRIGVLNAGIGGNRILHDAGISNIRFGVNALARFDRDVLAQPGVRYVIVLEGINDLGHAGTAAPESEAVSADEIIAGLKQLAERAHETGIKIFGATMTPFSGTASKGYFTPEKEASRQTVNTWIRQNKTFDGVIDFDKATQDPSSTDHLLQSYDSSDHLHPNDAGYKAMADSVPLSLFQ